MTEFQQFLEIIPEGGIYSHLKSFFAFCLSFLLLFLTVRLLSVRFKRLAKKTANTFDDLLAEIFSKTHPFVLAAVSIYIASHFAPLGEAAKQVAKGIAVGALIFQVVSWAVRITDYQLMRRYGGWGMTVTQARGLVFFLKVILWFLAALVLFENLGVRVTPLIAGLGIGGIALALALQSVLGELIASLSIVIDKPFIVGDFIIVGDHMGTVEKVGFKTTRLRSISGEMIIFSNGDLIQNTIRNYKNLPRRRSFSTLGVVYETSTAKLKRIPQIVKDIIRRHPKTTGERAHFVSFGDFSLNFEVAYYVLTSDYTQYLDAQEQINYEIIKAFRDENIEFAYPTQTLFAGKPLEVSVKN